MSVIPAPTPENQFLSDTKQKKGKREILPVVFFALVFVAVAGGGAFAYFYYFQPPEAVIGRMVKKLAEVKSVEYSGEARLETTGGSPAELDFQGSSSETKNEKYFLQQPQNFSIAFSGAFDTQDINNLKVDSRIALTDLSQDAKNTLDLQLKIISQNLYVRLNKMSGLGFLGLSIASDKWIRFGYSELKKKGGVALQPDRSEPAGELSDEQREKIEQAMRQSQVFEFAEKLGANEIDGVATYHYKIAIDKEKILKLAAEIRRIEGKPLTEPEIKEVENNLRKIDFENVEIWIGKNDSFPRKLILAAVFNGENGGIQKLDISLLLKNFNKTVQIEIPSPVIDLEDAFKNALNQIIPHE